MSSDNFGFEGRYEEFLEPCVLAVGYDSLMLADLSDSVAAEGGRLVLLQEGEMLIDAVDLCFPVLMLLDLSSASDWALAIQRCKARPESRQMQIYAYAGDVHAELLPRALEAGADCAWTDTQLLAELQTVVGRHINPQENRLDGWDDLLPEKAYRGLTLLNEGDYFEQHELLEEAWLAEKRPIRVLYQGILQIGVALLQIERGNGAGAIKMLRRGIPKLRTLPERCQGIEVGLFRAQAMQIHALLCAGGPSAAAAVDRSRFPQIRFD